MKSFACGGHQQPRCCSWYLKLHLACCVARPDPFCHRQVNLCKSVVTCRCVNTVKKWLVLQVILSGEATAADVSTLKIADSTEGFSGSDLRQLCTAAAMCSIRDLMKATSKASRDKAAGKKAKRAAKLSPLAEGSDRCAQPDTVEPGIAGSSQAQQQAGDATAGTGSQEQEDGLNSTGTSAQASSSQPSERSLSLAAAAAAVDERSHDKVSKGNKRDGAEGVGGSLTKRRKSGSDGSDVGASHNQGSDPERALHATAGSPTDSNNHAADASSVQGSAEATSGDQSPSLNAYAEAGSGDSGVSQSLGKPLKGRPQQPEPAAGAQDRSATVEWLLAKYSDVAAAADQQVCRCCQACEQVLQHSTSSVMWTMLGWLLHCSLQPLTATYVALR